jgi:hypothetical protein
MKAVRPRLAALGVLAVLMAAMLVAAGCGPGAATPSPITVPTVAPTPRPPDMPVATPPPVATPLPVTAVPPPMLQAVMTEAARLSGIPADRIAILRSEQTVWPDSSLGCALPDEMYTTVLTNGYWVILEAGTVLYDFRITSDGTFRLCPHPEGSDAA